jgi:NADPH-dependent 2,4-dienoyl-CoA reductase/sulfur reductase-like enzyme
LHGLARATVVGSGFIAAETASGLAELGVAVRLVVRRSLFAKFGAGVAAMAEALFAEHGVAIQRGSGEIDGGRGGVAGAGDLRGAGGGSDLAIGAIGSDPAVHWLGEFAADRGAVIRTDPVGLVEGETRIFAVGDVAWRWNNRHRQYVRSGHWASAIVDAKVTAEFLATGETRHNERSGLQGFSSSHFGVTLQGIGNISVADEVRCDGDYRDEGWAGSRFYRAGTLCGAISYGRPAYIMQALPEMLNEPA